jgi:sugar phosphate permease
VRRASQSLALSVPATCLLVLGAAGEGGISPSGSIALVTIAIVFGATSHSGYWANIIDIGPTHAGLLSGISNTFAQLPGIVGNLVTGYTLQSAGWSSVFVQVACIQLVGMTFYIIFARADVRFD